MTITPSSGSSRTPDSENRYKRRTRDDRNSGTRSPRPVRGGSRCRLGSSRAPPPSPFDPLDAAALRTFASVWAPVNDPSDAGFTDDPLAIRARAPGDVECRTGKHGTGPDLAGPLNGVGLCMDCPHAVTPFHQASHVDAV